MISDEGFVHNLKGSQPYVYLIADLLESSGFTVIVPRLKVRPTFEQRSDFKDDGDIWIHCEDRLWRPIEVKHRLNLDFVNRKSFRFPTIIVDQVKSYDSKKYKPYVYFIINEPATHLAMIHCCMAPYWGKEWKYSTPDNETLEFYCCPKYLTEFRSLRRRSWIGKSGVR